MFNPRGSMYSQHGRRQGGLVYLWRLFSEWAQVKERYLFTSASRMGHWVRLSITGAIFWSSATFFGTVGVLLTVGLLFSQTSHAALPKKIESDQRFETPPPEQDSLLSVGSLPFAPAPAIVEKRTPVQQTPIIPRRQSTLPIRKTLVIGPLGIQPEPVNNAIARSIPINPLWGIRDPFRLNYSNTNGANTNSGLGPLSNPYASRRNQQLTEFDITPLPSATSATPSASDNWRSEGVGFAVMSNWPRGSAAGVQSEFQLIVRNMTGNAAEHVRIRQTVHPIERVLDVAPAAGVVGNQFIWDEIDWPAGEERVYSLSVVPDTRSVFGTARIEILAQAGSATTVVEAAAPVRRMNLVPSGDLLPDDPEPYQSRIAPSPVRELPNDSFPQTRRTAPRPVEVFPVEPLPESRPMMRRPTIKPEAVATTLKMQMTLPASRIGEVATIRFQIKNIGSLPSKETRLLVTLPESLGHPMGRELILPIGRLEPGKSFKTNLYADVVGADALFVSAATDASNARREEADGVLPVNSSDRATSRKPALQPDGDMTVVRQRNR